MKKEEIWVYTETHSNLVHPVTFQLITKAKKIANNKNVVVVVFENQTDDFTEQIKAYGPDEIIVIKDEKLTNARDSLIADLLKQLAEKRNPNTILFGATVSGRSISARLQAKLNTGLTADCLDLSYEDNLLIQTKPSYGDNIMCEIICPNHLPQMATVRPNIFVAEKKTNKNLVITNIDDLIFKIDDRIHLKNEISLLSKSDSIANASRVIAIGRGACDGETLELINKLSSKLGAKIGVTRPLTDLPTFSAEDQIGQSGNTITPKLLINLGIHGAVQFTAGIEKSELIISVNNNKEAPIFNLSDYSYVGDAKAFVEAFLKVIQ